MADVEEYFPRGGKKPAVTYFKQNANFLGAIEKGEKKKKKPKKKVEGDDGYLSDEDVTKTEVDRSFQNCAVGLSYKVVREGLLVLGRVVNVTETKINVMLPCRLTGTVMACHVSNAYNKLLEDYVNDKIENIRELPEMFKKGQYVATKVIETKEDHLMLSLMPQHINSCKSHSDLHKGTILQAAVTSVEDHGFVMDIGVPNTTAFLPMSNTNPEIELDTGVLTWCCVKSMTSSPESCVVTLANDLPTLQSTVCKKKTNDLLPGTAVDFKVNRALENGIEGQIFDRKAYIQRQHTDSGKGKKPALGQKIRARVLYTMPTRNTPFLTSRNIFETTFPDLEEEQKFKEGDIVDEATVIKITGRSIQFRLGKGSIGTMSLKRVAIHEDLTDEEVVAKSYPIGSTHKVRILLYHLADYAYSVTDQHDVITEKYFSLEQLNIGEIVEGTVKTVYDNNLTIDVGRVTGYVPQTHISDAGVFVDPKKSSTSKLTKKKFKVGQEVKARVIAVDSMKSLLFLTLKPSLLVPDLEVLSSYEQAEVGKAYTGVIKVVRDYLLVSFFNNVIAYVPRYYVTKETVTSLTDMFHAGQIVNCTILNVDIENKKMVGSLTTVPFWPAKKREKTEKRKLDTAQIDVPKKRQKSDDEDAANSDLTTKRKKKKNSENDDKIDETDMTNKKLKKNKSKDLQESESVEKLAVKKSKKNRKESKEVQVESKEAKEKNNKKKTKDKPEKVEESRVLSEESDAIETDIHEDSDSVLTSQDMGLIDLSDCITPKTIKKRVVSLLKSIRARTKRIKVIDNKISNIERLGLSARNKKYHTAMHTEKLVIEKRIEKLREALNLVQEKLKEYNVEFNQDYKIKKNKRKDSVSEDSGNEEEPVKPKKEVKLKRKKEETEVKVKERKSKVLEKLEPALEVPSAENFWSTNAEIISKTTQEEESSSSDDEDRDQPKKKRKKLTAAEKVAKAREEEERVRELERAAAQSSVQPRSSEQFERALLASPACSQLWIAYMAFHLQATEIEKARAVARKALNTISFREELEKLNVWLALLNVEHRFGTQETQQRTLEEAVAMNEPFKVHSKLLDILVETSKPQELSSLVELMQKKYKRDPQCYIACGDACYRMGLVDKARQVMQKAISILEKKEHVSVLVQFAQMERAMGACERAEALLEQVLAVYPQRVDVCALYVDALLKDRDIDRIRQLLERMTSMKLPARKMKVLYKKWVEVEEKIGDPEKAESVRQQALTYIEKAKF